MIDFGKMKTITMVALILLVLGLVFIVGGFLTRDPDEQPVLFPTAESIGIDISELPTEVPIIRPTTSYVSVTSSLSVALSGEYGNGGIWEWEEIKNLMNIYGNNGLFAVTYDGQRYEGVPLAYLISYSEVNSYADVIVITGANNVVYAYPVDTLMNCANCILAATEDDTLVVVMPSLEPYIIQSARHLDAATNADANEKLAAAAETQRLANNATIRMYGLVSGSEAWTWEDISGLLGVYDTPNNFQRYTVNGVSYAGVPVSYLMHYMQMDSSANTLQLTFSNRQQRTYTFSQLDDLVNLLIAQSGDDTFDMLVASPQGIEVWPDLSGIRAESLAQQVSIPADPRTVNLFSGFENGGEWTWADIANLIGVYEEADTLHTIELDGTSYNGVPLPYLLHYAGTVETRPSVFSIYNREGLSQNMTYNSIRGCVDCMIVSASDGTLTLVLPELTPSIIRELAALEVK